MCGHGPAPIYLVTVRFDWVVGAGCRTASDWRKNSVARKTVENAEIAGLVAVEHSP